MAVSAADGSQDAQHENDRSRTGKPGGRWISLTVARRTYGRRKCVGKKLSEDERHKAHMARALEIALGHTAPAFLERVPSRLRARESGATLRRMPAVRDLLPVGLALPFFP
jgi:hypothetical protein